MTEQLDSYLQKTGQQGRFDSEGTFTLNLERARVKLHRFRLERPSHYLLKFVQGAVQLRAQEFEALIKPGRVRLKFSCAGARLSQLESILRYLQQPEEVAPEPAYHLAFGLAALMAKEKGTIELSLTTPEKTERLLVEPDGLEVTRGPGSGVGPDITVLRLEFKRGSQVWAGKAGREMAASERECMARCRLAPLLLTVNGKPVEEWPAPKEPSLLERQILSDDSTLEIIHAGFSHFALTHGEDLKLVRGARFRPPPTRAYVLDRWKAPSWSGVLQLPIEKSGKLQFLVHGVLTPPEDIVIGLHATLDVPEVRTDLSGLRAVRNESYRQIISDLKNQYRSMYRLFLTHQSRVEKSLIPKSQLSFFQESVRTHGALKGFEPLEGQAIGSWRLIEKIEARERLYRASHLKTGNAALFWIVRGKRHRALMDRWAELDLGYQAPPFLAGRMPEGEEGYLATEARATLKMLLDKDLDNPLEVVFKIGELLCLAHEQGFSHCDIHPDSILFNEAGEPFLRPPLRFQDIKTTVTVAGKFFWISFFAPEQIVGAMAIPATDQFSLAALTHLLLAGTEIFGEKDQPMARILALLMEEPQRPSSIDPVVWSVLSKALSKDPDDRYQDLRSMLTALRTALET